MSLATFKALTSLTVLASIPIYGAYLVTADHSALKFGTVASKSIEGRFRAFDDRARDSLPVEERRHRFQRMREGREL
ncbi:hypothetical protein SMMN14_04983 [Sphaerulina musiva]